MKKILVLSILISSVFATLMMYVAWEHNSQCEIHDNGIIDFSYLFTIGISWFLLGFIALFLLMNIVGYLRKGLNR